MWAEMSSSSEKQMLVIWLFNLILYFKLGILMYILIHEH